MTINRVLVVALSSLIAAIVPAAATPQVMRLHKFHNFNPTMIAVDSSGHPWLVGMSGRMFARLNRDGSFEYFALPQLDTQVQDITRGPNGTIWFVATQTYDGSHNFVGQISANGAVQAYPVNRNGANLRNITLGQDGNIWFTEFGAGRIGRIDSKGHIREFALPEQDAAPLSITSLRNGSIWTIGSHFIFELSPNGVVRAYRSIVPQRPRSVSSTGNENLLVTFYGSAMLLRVTSDHHMTAYTQSAHRFGVTAISRASNGEAIAFDIDTASIARITKNGVIIDWYHLGERLFANQVIELNAGQVCFVSLRGDAYGCVLGRLPDAPGKQPRIKNGHIP